MSPSPVLRRARVEDAAELSGLIVGTLRTSNAVDYGPAVIDRVAEAFSPAHVATMVAHRHVLVACDADGRILGTAALDGAVVRSVFVAPGAQGRGIGRALMAAIFDLAKDTGIAVLTLQSSLTAQGFYAGLGFVADHAVRHGEEVTIAMRREPLGGCQAAAGIRQL